MKTKKKKEVKMSKPKTYVVMILDQSGSMGGTKAQAVQGYNEQVQQMKLNSKDQDIFCSLITFNGEVFEHLWCEPADKLTEATTEDYKTEGSTAMRDAVGYAIEKLQRTTDSKEDVAYLVVIVSDGEENASKHYSIEALNELKASAEKTGKWTFTYMGCNERYLKKISQEMNIPISNMALWSNATPALAAQGMLRSCKKVDHYYKSRAVGQVQNSNVYSDDVVCLADFTEESPEDDLVNKMLGGIVPLTPPLNLTVTCGGSSPFKNYAPVSWTK